MSKMMNERESNEWYLLWPGAEGGGGEGGHLAPLKFQMPPPPPPHTKDKNKK